MSLHVPPLRTKLATLSQNNATPAAPTNCASFGISSNRSAIAVEFRPDPQSRVGFAMAQFCHYTLEANSDAATAQVAPERLIIGFSTADVTILGARLGPIADALNAGTLEWVAKISERYANLDQNPWVADIAFGRFDKSSAG